MARCPKQPGTRAWTGIAVFGAVLLFALPAPAQTDQELAERHYKLGEAMYKRSDYRHAVEQFEQSYQYSRKPELLYNIARCYESLGQPQKAIDFYQRYLASSPEQSKVIEERIKNLRSLVEQSGGTAEVTGRAPATTAPQRTAGEQREPEPAGTGSRPLRLSGWILVGAGAALFVTAIATGAMAGSKAGDVETAGAEGKDWSQVRDTYDSGSALEKASIGTWVAGGVAAATGVVLLVLDARASRGERRAWLAPGLASGGALLSGWLRF